MTNWAKINENNIVTHVIVADEDFINSGAVGSSTDWVECINNVSSIGWSYTEQEQKFYPPKEYDSWIWNEEYTRWEPPIPYPDPNLELGNGAYSWNEEDGNWERMVD
jgi:hypothetical protein